MKQRAALFSFALFAGLLAIDILPWMAIRRYLPFRIALLSLLSAFFWLLSLWWSLHNLWFRVLALFALPEVRRTGGLPIGHFRILCVVCDDFVPESLRTCIDQDFAPDGFSVIVCDDSSTEQVKREIDRFCLEHSLAPPIRRESRGGFKAGNLNHALRQIHPDDNDWAVIVDADDLLPQDFLKNLHAIAQECPPEVAFLQGDLLPAEDLPRPAHQDSPACHSSTFRQFVQSELRMKSGHDVPWREAAGFFCFLGHGGAIRAAAWRKLGGFPTCVAEDMAFTMLANQASLSGSRIPHVGAYEPSPLGFAGYLVRCRKYAAGAAEIVSKYLPAFLRSNVPFRDKVDSCMKLATFVMPTLTFANLWLSTYVAHTVWQADLPLLSPTLPYLFIAMFLVSWATSVSSAGGYISGARFLWNAFAIYAAAMPVMAWEFMLSLLTRPVFQRTPKGGDPGQVSPWLTILTMACGTGLVLWALRWPSPFSAVALSFGLGQVLFPVVQQLHRRDPVWSGIAQIVILLPGSVFVGGLVWMWLRAS